MAPVLGDKQVSSGGRHGGKRKGAGRPKTGRDDGTAKIDRGLLAQAKYVANARGTTVASLLTELLAEPIRREFAQALKEAGMKGVRP